MLARLLMFLVAGVMVSSAANAGDLSSGIPELSLQAFTARVAAYYPRLKAVNNDIEIAVAQKMQAQAGFWPTLDLSAGYKISNDPVNVFGMLLHQERFTASDFDLKRLNTPDRHQDLSAGLHVEMPLFDAMQTIHRVRAARASVKAAESDGDFAQMEVALLAQDAFWHALTLEKMAAVITEVEKRSGEDLQKARDLKDKGMILGADYFAARVMFGDFERMKNEISRQQIAMLALLNILMGESPEKVWALSSPFNEADLSVYDRQKLIAAAIVNRPDIAALSARLQAEDSELSRVKATTLPIFSMFGDAANDRNSFLSSGGSSYTVGLKAAWPLFDPSREGRVKEFRVKKEQMGFALQRLKDDVARDITEELARYDALRDNMDILKEMSDDAKEAVRLTVPLYSEGRKSIADLLEIRRAYLQSAQAYAKARIESRLVQARLLFLTGQLTAAEVSKRSEGSGS